MSCTQVGSKRAKTGIECAKHEQGDQGMTVQRASVAPAKSFTMELQSADAPRCSSFNHTTAQGAPMSHNLTSSSAVEAGGRAIRKRKVDVGISELEAFKELFQVFSLTQRHVVPEGNCMPLSAAESTLWQDMSGGNERKEISKARREARAKEIRQGAVAYVEQHAEDFQDFLVTEQRSKKLDALEGERQRTVKEWCTRMGEPKEQGDNILLRAIALHLKRPVQVFSYDSKDDTIYMQTIACGNLSKEETMEVSSDRRRPQVSDFEDTDTLRLVYQQHQFIDAGHCNCIISNKVCARSLGARPLSGSL